MTELKEFRLPDVGEGLTEADIVRWHVRPGDEITVNQIIVEIETAKAVVELPSPYEGVVADLLVPEGTTADVGTPIIAVRVGNGAVAPGTGPGAISGAISEAPAEGAVEPGIYGSPAPKEEHPAVLVGYGVKLGATKRRPRKAGPVPGAGPAPGTPPGAAAGTAPGREPATKPGPPGRGPFTVLAKPPVRKMAKDLGVDLAALAGTGQGGSITREDVLAAAGPSQLPREERIPVRGVRKHTAAAVTASAFTAPHVTEFLQIDITETMAATDRLRSLPDFDGVRISPLLLVARALLIAAARHPLVNSSWDEAGQEIVVRHYVNLGIAATTDRGLVVPNVKDAQAMSLPRLARALGELAQNARAGKSAQADLRDGTITITNVGVFGVDAGTPIITPGEAAILAFGQVKDAPWVHEGQLAVRKVCTLALSFDHRIIDGDVGSAVLREVGAMLTDPLRMLAWS